MMSAAVPTLSITALSPVATASTFCRLAGFLWATVIVKATFELVHGEAARLVQAEELVHTDHPSAPLHSLVRARETAPHLPNAGVILTGHACAPDGRAVSSMSVRLGLSRDRPVIDKTQHVFGARAAQNPAAIAPFQRMPLVYERAAGGPHSPENPVGVGGPGSAVYPNIVDPKDPRNVAGFGPVSPHWAPRRGCIQGLDPAALEAPILDVPAGFDWRFFQAAPRDQQIDRLHGDEWIVLDGMDSMRPRVQSRLPEVTARARRRVADARGVVTEEGVELRADMLVIDADRAVASLVWRGRFAIDSLDSLARTTVLVGLEQPGRPVAWPAVAPPRQDIAPQAATMETQEVNLAALLGAKVPFAPERDSHLPTPIAAHRPANEPPRSQMTGTAAVDVQLLLRGLLPFAELPGSAAEKAAKRADPLPFEPADPERPSPASLPTPAAQKAPRMDTATADIDVAQILRAKAPFEREVAQRPIADVPTPHLTPPPPISTPEPPVLIAPPETRSQPDLIVETPVLATPPRSDAGSLRARVMEKLANKASFDGDDLSFANLSGLDLTGCSLARCVLRGAKLRGTKLGGAMLSRAVLDEADLRGAQLEGANLSEASLVNADLEQACLARAIADHADLRDALLRDADLQGARLTEARLIGATMCGARLSRADLSGARLDAVDLTDAHLEDVLARGAVFSNARLDGADLRRADLTGANLHKWSTRRARLAGANLQKTTDSAPECDPGAPQMLPFTSRMD